MQMRVRVEHVQDNNQTELQSSDRDGIIVLSNVTKSFGKTTVLDNISLAIKSGKTTVVIGESGFLSCQQNDFRI